MDDPEIGRPAGRVARRDLVITVALKDYETIARMRDEVVSIGENRLNFFLATVVGALGIIALVPGQLVVAGLISAAQVGTLAALGVVALLALGFSTYARMIRRFQTLTRYTEALEQARLVAIQAAEIEGKLAARVVNLELGPFIRTGLGVAATVALINVVVVAAATLVLVGPIGYPWTWPAIAGAVTVIMHLGYAWLALRAQPHDPDADGGGGTGQRYWLRSMVVLAIVIVLVRMVAGLFVPASLPFLDLLLVAIFGAALIGLNRSGR